MFAAMTCARACWRAIWMTGFWRRQMANVRDGLAAAYREYVGLADVRSTEAHPEQVFQAAPGPRISLHRGESPVMLRILAAIVIILGLAACSGGGGSGIGKVTVDTAKDQREAITSAIQDAQGAIRALDNDATDADLAAAADLIEAAEEAVAAADALAEEERDSLNTAVSVLEDSLASARARILNSRKTQRLTAAEEAMKVRTAIAGARITEIGAEVKHGAPPVMSGTIPGEPPTAVDDLETTAPPGGTTTTNRWTRGLYTVPADDGTLVDTIVLYTNIAPTGTRPFSGDGGKYSVANGLDDDGNLPIVAATDATLIASAGFPAGPALRTHDAGAAGTVEVIGSFDGASGTYVCTPATDSACQSSFQLGGGISLSGGGDAGWKFVPTTGATVREPDDEYQYFGWWLRNTDGSYAVGLFHHGEGSAADEFTALPALQGTATYTGPAVGLFAIIPQPGDASSGDFTATVRLEADFGDGTDLGTVEGTVDGFMVNGQARDWSVELQAAEIGTNGAITPGSTATALTYWTIGDVKAQRTANWSGQFHDADADRTPVVATGQFEAVHGTTGHMIGAFGAHRQ